MAYLNLHLDYFEHPKTKRLVRLLGKGSEVLPLKLWAYTARYFATDGRLTGLSAQEIEEECRWWGGAGKMIEAMLEVRLLVCDGETLCVHQWDEHEGHISAFQQRAKKGAEARWDKIKGKPDGGKPDAPSNALDDATSNASSIPSSNASSNAPTNLPTKPSVPTNPTNPPPTPRKRGEGGPMPGFDAFWAAWPAHERKDDPGRCRKKWLAAGLEDRTAEIVASLEQWKVSNAWTKDGGEYIPMPLTWLNKKRYENTPALAKGPVPSPADDYGPPPPGYVATFSPAALQAIEEVNAQKRAAADAAKAGAP